MLTTADPADMTPDQRRAEVAAILAAGLQRLIRRGPSPSSDPPEKPDKDLRPPPRRAPKKPRN